MSNELLVSSKALGKLCNNRHVITRRIIYTYIILHNVILKCQKFTVSEFNELYISLQQNIQRLRIERCTIQRMKDKEELRDKQTHET